MKKKNDDWKVKNKRYLKEVQKMLDIIDNVKDEELKNRIVLQFVKCEDLITELAIDELNR